MNNKLMIELVDKEIDNIFKQVKACDIKPNVAGFKLQWLNLDKRLKDLQKSRIDLINNLK